MTLHNDPQALMAMSVHCSAAFTDCRCSVVGLLLRGYHAFTPEQGGLDGILECPVYVHLVSRLHGFTSQARTVPARFSASRMALRI